MNITSAPHKQSQKESIAPVIDQAWFVSVVNFAAACLSCLQMFTAHGLSAHVVWMARECLEYLEMLEMLGALDITTLT